MIKGYYTIEGVYRFSRDEREIAKRNGLTARRIYDRVNLLNWLPERAISTPVRNRTDYSKHASEAKKNGISPQAFSQRVHRQGWSIEEAKTVPIGMYRGRRSVKYTPEQYKIAKENGISKSTLSNRLTRLGWDIERAITEKPSYSRRKRNV